MHMNINILTEMDLEQKIYYRKQLQNVRDLSFSLEKEKI